MMASRSLFFIPLRGIYEGGSPCGYDREGRRQVPLQLHACIDFLPDQQLQSSGTCSVRTRAAGVWVGRMEEYRGV